ncbi:unnamed protein product [Anisakis simplex]|uniref:Uncharacterized protein n=1 Tax=Anisakis simplex TaxID=6269 RepID=A0A3P6Q7X9_ANISI|nr:unnamed protein product [Anisakis simplex]
MSSSSSSASPSPAPAKSPSPASKSPSPEDSTTTESSILERAEERSLPTSVGGGLHTKSERQPSGYLAERLAAGAAVERPQSVVQPQKSQEISSQSKHIAYPVSRSRRLRFYSHFLRIL